MLWLLGSLLPVQQLSDSVKLTTFHLVSRLSPLLVIIIIIIITIIIIFITFMKGFYNFSLSRIIMSSSLLGMVLAICIC